MSLPLLSDDLILFLCKMFKTNIEMISLIRTCKRFLELGRRYGYIKSLRLDLHSNYIKFAQLYNHLFLDKLVISNINNPLFWIPSKRWPKIMIFENCCMGTEYIDPDVSETEVLVIQDIKRRTHINTLRINWNKLPKLRVLQLFIKDVDLSGLENCCNLKDIRIDVHNDNKFMDFNTKFPMVEKIAITRYWINDNKYE